MLPPSCLRVLLTGCLILNCTFFEGSAITDWERRVYGKEAESSRSQQRDSRPRLVEQKLCSPPSSRLNDEAAFCAALDYVPKKMRVGTKCVEQHWVRKANEVYKHVGNPTATVLPDGTLLAAWQTAFEQEGQSDQHIATSISDNGGRHWSLPQHHILGEDYRFTTFKEKPAENLDTHKSEVFKAMFGNNRLGLGTTYTLRKPQWNPVLMRLDDNFVPTLFLSSSESCHTMGGGDKTRWDPGGNLLLTRLRRWQLARNEVLQWEPPQKMRAEDDSPGVLSSPPVANANSVHVKRRQLLVPYELLNPSRGSTCFGSEGSCLSQTGSILGQISGALHPNGTAPHKQAQLVTEAAVTSACWAGTGIEPSRCQWRWTEADCMPRVEGHFMYRGGSVLMLPSGKMLQFFQSNLGQIYMSASKTGGVKWDLPTATKLANPNTRIHAIALKYPAGAIAVAHNPTNPYVHKHTNPRNALAISISIDHGDTWDEIARIGISEKDDALDSPTLFQRGCDLYMIYSVAALKDSGKTKGIRLARFPLLKYNVSTSPYG